MTWAALALATALFYGVQGAWSKRVTGTASPLAASWALFAFALPVLAPWLAFRGVPEIAPAFWPALVTNVSLSLLSFYLYVSAIQRGQLGLTYPLLALTPILVVPVEWALLGEVPGTRALAGIGLVVTGVYALYLEPGRSGPLDPFRALARDPGARRMLAVAVLWSVSGVVDRVAVLSSSTPFYGVALCSLLGVAYLPLLARRGGGLRRALAPEARWLLLVQGLLFGAMFVCQMEAIRRTLAAHVIAIKRSGALLTVVLGALLFREPHLGRRAAATLVTAAGVFLVATG